MTWEEYVRGVADLEVPIGSDMVSLQYKRMILEARAMIELQRSKEA